MLAEVPTSDRNNRADDMKHVNVILLYMAKKGVGGIASRWTGNTFWGEFTMSECWYGQ